jgi:hypothetical protein
MKKLMKYPAITLFFFSAFTASIRLPAYCARLPASDRHASLPDSPIGGAAYAHSRA